MKLRRPISPAYVTPREAIAYLASVCDGAIRRDGHGFSADHVVIGHGLATRHRWRRSDRRSALQLTRIYRGQLETAGFATGTLVSSRTPPRMSRRRAARLTPGWFIDPAGVHRRRYWNGAR